MKARLIVPVLFLAAVLALCGAAATSSAQAQAARSPDASVAAWDAVGTQAFTAAALSPAEGHVIFAYVAIAVYDSVMAIDGGYRPFAIDVDAPKGASAEAAVAAAAYRILAHYLPAQDQGILKPAYDASLASIRAGRAKEDGIGTGEQVAALLIARRANDRFRNAVTYTAPNPPIPGVWLPTAPTPPIGTYLGGMRPFSLKSAGQFRPGGPPALSSKRWARDYNEVKELGSNAIPTNRTPEQTAVALFYIENSIVMFNRTFRFRPYGTRHATGGLSVTASGRPTPCWSSAGA